MRRYELSRSAYADLANIADYTQETWGRDQAVAYLRGLQASLERLVEQPYLGRERTDLGEGLRSALFERHMIYYVVKRAGIVVVRILHGRQDPTRHLKQPPT